MNWDAAGAIAEVIGAITVVISVIYLAVQIRRQTDQSRLAATRELTEQHSDIINRIIDDELTADLYLRAVKDFGALTSVERIRVSLLFHRMMRLIEQQHLHIEKGQIDPEFFKSMDQMFFEWLTFPGVQAWWEEGSKDFFVGGFRRHMDEQFLDAKTRGYSSTYKADQEQQPDHDDTT